MMQDLMCRLSSGVKIDAGRINQELVDVVDLFETFCELTATKHRVETDGRSIVNQIHGKKAQLQWVHRGLPQGESIFDGKWLSHQDEKASCT